MTQGTAGRLEERHDRYIDLIKQFTIMNDIFMRNVLKEESVHRVYPSDYYREYRITYCRASVADGLCQSTWKSCETGLCGVRYCE